MTLLDQIRARSDRDLDDEVQTRADRAYLLRLYSEIALEIESLTNWNTDDWGNGFEACRAICLRVLRRADD